MTDRIDASGLGGPQVLVTHFVDLTQLFSQQPDVKRLAVVTRGDTIEWQAKFRRVVREVCKDRAFPVPVPSRLMAAAIRARGILLLWPCDDDDTRGFEVQVSPAGRRITTDLAVAFGELGVHMPQEVTVAVPVTRYLHPSFGECLALHFTAAEFLPEKSRTAAGLMP